MLSFRLHLWSSVEQIKVCVRKVRTKNQSTVKIYALKTKQKTSYTNTDKVTFKNSTVVKTPSLCWSIAVNQQNVAKCWHSCSQKCCIACNISVLPDKHLITGGKETMIKFALKLFWYEVCISIINIQNCVCILFRKKILKQMGRKSSSKFFHRFIVVRCFKSVWSFKDSRWIVWLETISTVIWLHSRDRF